MSISDKLIAAQLRIVDRLIEWEELVGELYKRYAVRFPEQGHKLGALEGQSCRAKPHFSQDRAIRRGVL